MDFQGTNIDKLFLHVMKSMLKKSKVLVANEVPGGMLNVKMTLISVLFWMQGLIILWLCCKLFLLITKFFAQIPELTPAVRDRLWVNYTATRTALLRH